MSEIKAMTKRNLLIYFRNKSAVFFSILSALILLAIMVVFLGESSSEGLLERIEPIWNWHSRGKCKKCLVAGSIVDHGWYSGY